MERLWHPWWAWENVPAGFYEGHAGDLNEAQARDEYANFLRDTTRFEAALDRVLLEWPIACEQFLSNENINRIAWLGQAAMCIETGIPSKYRGGFNLLTPEQQYEANQTAERALERWKIAHAVPPQ